jgi:hypothetical protein
LENPRYARSDLEIKIGADRRGARAATSEAAVDVWPGTSCRRAGTDDAGACATIGERRDKTIEIILFQQ